MDNKVKKLYPSNRITTMTYLRYQFLNRNGKVMELSRIENLKVEIAFKGVYHDITSECQKIGASKTLSIFVSPSTIKEIFGKKNCVCRIVIKWCYRNSTVEQTYIDTLKFTDDNFSHDLRNRNQKRSGKGKGGRKAKRSQKSEFYEAIGFIVP